MRVQILSPILEHHRKIDIQIYHCFINGCPYFHTISDKTIFKKMKPYKIIVKRDIFSNTR